MPVLKLVFLYFIGIYRDYKTILIVQNDVYSCINPKVCI